MNKTEIIYKNIDELVPYENNPRHNDQGVDALAESIKEFGFKVPIIIDSDGVIVAGHTRLKACKKLGIDEVPCIVADDLTDEQIKAFRLADNKVAELSDWDQAKLKAELRNIEMDMENFGFDHTDYNYKLTTQEKARENKGLAALLSDTFIITPSSVLDTRAGDWQERKKKWIDIGLVSKEGRDENLLFAQSMNMRGNASGGTSIFDPVLTEICYRWFTPKQEQIKILDPFAGGSVRGVVAEVLGMQYTGIDLRQEQIDTNKKQAEEIGLQNHSIRWYQGDSRNIDQIVDDEDYDLLFTCPPYADLEVYSDDPRDISNCDYKEFIEAYKEILTKAAAKVKNNRFIIIVTSDVRDSQGFYNRLTDDTARIMEEQGIRLYNEQILVNSFATGGLRARRNMRTRKTVRTHQKVQSFFKGDPEEIKNIYTTKDAEKDMEEKVINNTYEKVQVYFKGKPQEIKDDFPELTEEDLKATDI